MYQRDYEAGRRSRRNHARQLGRVPDVPGMELGPEIAAKRDLRRALYDSLDAAGRARGEIRP